MNKIVPVWMGMVLGTIMAHGAESADRIKLACVGDSITQGVGSQGKSYPKQLAVLLGDKWEMHNFGVSGRMMTRSNKAAWTNTMSYPRALDFKPDVVTIMLGTNDSKIQTWDEKQKESFLSSSRDLVADFRKVNSAVKVYLCLPPPVYKRMGQINDEGVRTVICPLLRQVAGETHVTLIDTYTAAGGHPEGFPDGVHPNPAGAELLAKAIHQALIGAPASSAAR